MRNIISVLMLIVLLGCRPTSDFDALFKSLSTGIPQYQQIERFSHPADAAKGDFFSTDFTQSPDQFHNFVSKLGVSEADVLSSKGALQVKVNTKPNSQYPWFLNAKAEATGVGQKVFHVHVEGRQMYD